MRSRVRFSPFERKQERREKMAGLERILTRFPPVSLCFAYGSAIFKQLDSHGKPASNKQVRLSLSLSASLRRSSFSPTNKREKESGGRRVCGQEHQRVAHRQPIGESNTLSPLSETVARFDHRESPKTSGPALLRPVCLDRRHRWRLSLSVSLSFRPPH